MIRISFLSTIVSIFLFAFPSWAIDELHPFYEGVRGKGMGGVQVATVNDETALVVNPSGLGKLRDYYGTIIDPDIDASASFVDNISNVTSVGITDLAKLKTTLSSKTQTYYHYNQQYLPSFVARNFGIGFLIKKNVDAYMDAAAANMDTFYRDDMALLLGYCLRLFDGHIKIGLSGKAISRIEMSKILSTSTNSFDLQTLANQGHVKEGFGMGYDVGLTMTAPWSMLPTLSAVARDVGGTRFTSRTGVRMSSTATPDEVKQDIDAGLSISPIHSKNVRSTWSVEYRNILTSSTVNDSRKQLFWGSEFNIADLAFLRFGMYQNYWTAGIELASEHYQFQLSTYGAETGTAAARMEDRRYNFKFAWRF